MNYITISTQSNETFSSISNHFIDYYMTDANGDFVKVYLYLVRLLTSKYPISVADIADHFNLTEKDICRAIKYWISKDVLKLNYNSQGELSGITLLPLKELDASADSLSQDDIILLELQTQGKKKGKSKETAPDSVEKGNDNSLALEEISSTTAAKQTHPDSETKSRTRSLPRRKAYSAELLAKAEDDAEFADVIFETETYFGTVLSVNDLEILIYMHDQLGFSNEIIEFLIEHCVTIGKKSLRYAEGIAKNWYKEGITTLEQARVAAKTAYYRPIFNQLGYDRAKATSIEIAYMESWFNSFHFDMTIVLEACNRTVLQCPGNPTITYVNGILQHWHDAGVKSVKDIEKLDKNFAAKKNLPKPNTVKPVRKTAFSDFSQKDMSKELAEMEKLLLDEINS